MNRIIPQLLALTVLAVVSTGCFTVNAALPGTLRTDITPEQTEKVGSLSYEDTHWFFIAGLISPPPEDYFAVEIKKQVQARGADGVANLNYEAQTGCLDIIISECTCSIITPRTYKITGDIVRIKAAPLPGNPAKAADATDATKEAGTVVAQQF